MKKNLMTLAAFLCCIMTTIALTACGNKENTTKTEDFEEITSLEIKVDSIVIKPYLEFRSSLADVEKYMADNFGDYTAINADSLTRVVKNDVTFYEKRYKKGNRQIGLFFNEFDSTFIASSYDYFFPIPLKPVMDELKRIGFKYMGEQKFDDFDTDKHYLFLSKDESIEVKLDSWEKNGGGWKISFLRPDENDFIYLMAE